MLHLIGYILEYYYELTLFSTLAGYVLRMTEAIPLLRLFMTVIGAKKAVMFQTYLAKWNCVSLQVQRRLGPTNVSQQGKA
jgi:hypothetical protein